MAAADSWTRSSTGVEGDAAQIDGVHHLALS